MYLVKKKKVHLKTLLIHIFKNNEIKIKAFGVILDFNFGCFKIKIKYIYKIIK